MYGDTGGVNLREAGVGKAGTLAVALEGGRTVRTHGVGREEEYVTVTTRGDYYGVSTVALNLTRYEVAGDDTLGLAILNHDVEHLVTRIALYRTGSDLLVQGCIGTQQKLLTRLTAGIEGTRYLRTTERTVSQQTAVLASERYTLRYALVDDEVRNLGQTIYVGLTGTVVTTLDRVVEEAIYRVVVVLVVLGCIDTALCGNRVGTTGRVLNAEYLHVVTQLTERCGSCATAQTGTDYDDIELTFVGRAHDLDRCLVVAPLVGECAGRNFSI